MPSFGLSDWQAAVARLSSITSEKWDEERFRAWLALPNTQKRLKSRYGEGFTASQAVSFLGAPEFDEDAEDGGTNDVVQGISIDKAWFDAEVEKRFNEVTRVMEDVLPHDASMLRQMVSAEVAVQHYYSILSIVDSPYKIASITNAINKLQGAIDRIQKTLGIDRSTRLESVQAQGEADRVMEHMAEVSRAALERTLKISHCGILIGWAVPLFRSREMVVEIVCPRCGERVRVEHVPTAEDLAEEETPTWVEAEEATAGGENDDLQLQESD